MAKYEERERRKFNDLGNQLGGIVTALSAADSATKAASLDRKVQILAMDNIKASAKTSIVGHDVPLQVDYDVPAAIISDMRALVVKEAMIETTMNVKASTEEALNINSKTQVGGASHVCLMALNFICSAHQVSPSQMRSVRSWKGVLPSRAYSSLRRVQALLLPYSPQLSQRLRGRYRICVCLPRGN